MADDARDSDEFDHSDIDFREVWTIDHIIEAEFKKSAGHTQLAFNEARKSIRIAVEILDQCCGFEPEHFYILIRRWRQLEAASLENMRTLLTTSVRFPYLAAVISEKLDDADTVLQSQPNLEQVKESVAAIDAELASLPPLQTENQLSRFLERAGALSQVDKDNLEREWSSSIRYEMQRIDIALVEVLKGFALLTGRIPWQQIDPSPPSVAARQERQEDEQPHQGVNTHPEQQARRAVVSKIMERGDEIVRLSDTSLEAMKIVLAALEVRRSNDPAEGNLKEQLALLIEQIEDARAATAIVSETNAVEDAEIAADKVEKSWVFLDQTFIDGIKDAGLKTVSGSLCFGLALGATAMFSVVGFPIPALSALAVSGGIFGVKGIADAISTSKSAR